ncbi:hypothetical protein PG984_015987 [Apiospora sp. TS-2023a]
MSRVRGLAFLAAVQSMAEEDGTDERDVSTWAAALYTMYIHLALAKVLCPSGCLLRRYLVEFGCFSERNPEEKTYLTKSTYTIQRSGRAWHRIHGLFLLHAAYLPMPETRFCQYQKRIPFSPLGAWRSSCRPLCDRRPNATLATSVGERKSGKRKWVFDSGPDSMQVRSARGNVGIAGIGNLLALTERQAGSGRLGAPPPLDKATAANLQFKVALGFQTPK